MRPGRAPARGARPRALARLARARATTTTRSPRRSARSRPTSAWSSPSISSRSSSPPVATRASAAAFVEALVAGAADPDQRLVVVLAIRADFYGRCAEYPELSAQISANQRARRADAPRGAAPGDRAARPAGPGCGSSRGWSRRWSATSPTSPAACRCSPPPWSSSGSERERPHACATRAYERSGGVSGAVARLAERRLRAPERAAARARRAADAAAARRRRAAGAGRPQAGPALRARARARPGRRPGARGAHREPAADRRRGHGRGRPRGAASRVAAAARLARGRRRGPAPSPAPDPRRRASGETRGAIRPSSTAAPGSPRRSTGRPSHDPELNELEREFLDESRAASEREAERQRRDQSPPADAARRRRGAARRRSRRRSDRALRAPGRAQRGHRRRRPAARGPGAQPRTASTRRFASPTPASPSTTRVATRSSLLSTLLRSPAALGVLNGDGDPLTALALSPDGGTLAVGDDERHRDPLRHRDAGANRRLPGAGRGHWALAFDPGGDSLAIRAQQARASEGRTCRSSTRPRSGCAARSRSAAYPADPASGYYPRPLIYAPDGRSLIVELLQRRLEYTAPVFLRRFDARSGSPMGAAVRVAPGSSKIAADLDARTGA